MTESATLDMNKTKILDKHKEKGKRMCDLIEGGVLVKATLPNHDEDYDLKRRMAALSGYVKFITSSSYDDIDDIEVLEYVGD